MKFAKKIEIKVTVKDNQFLKEQISYLQRSCNFSTVVEGAAWCQEQTDLEALVDSDEFIITLDPVTHRNGELTIVENLQYGEFQYIVGLTFKGTSITGHLYSSNAPYVLLAPSEIFLFIFPNVEFNKKRSSSYPISLNVDDYINPILSMVFGFKNEEKFKYEII